MQTHHSLLCEVNNGVMSCCGYMHCIAIQGTALD